MKKWYRVAFGLLFAFLLILPVQATMESHVVTQSLLSGGGTSFSAERLEEQMGLYEGDLLAVTILTLPRQGELSLAGIPIRKGETLLRKELTEIQYTSSKMEEDWFLLRSVGGKSCCLLLNLKPMNTSSRE